MKKFIALLIASWIVIIIYLVYFVEVETPQKEIEFIQGGDIQKAQMIDSLSSEIFILNIQINRYELTLEHLKETHPEAAKEFERFLSHETE